MTDWWEFPGLFAHDCESLSSKYRARPQNPTRHPRAPRPRRGKSWVGSGQLRHPWVHCAPCVHTCRLHCGSSRLRPRRPDNDHPWTCSRTWSHCRAAGQVFEELPARAGVVLCLHRSEVPNILLIKPRTPFPYRVISGLVAILFRPDSTPTSTSHRRAFLHTLIAIA